MRGWATFRHLELAHHQQMPLPILSVAVCFGCWCRLRLHWAACSSADVATELDAACLPHVLEAFGAFPAGRQWLPSWRCGSPVQQALLLEALQTVCNCGTVHRTTRRVEWG